MTRRSPGWRTSTGPSVPSRPAGRSSTRPRPRSPTSTTSRSPEPATAIAARRSLIDDLPRPARQPVRGARTISPVDRAGLPLRRCPPPPVVQRRVDTACRAAQYLGTWEGFRHRGDVSTSLRRRFYYPKGFTGLDRSFAGTADEPLGRRLRPDAPHQRAGAGKELPPVQRRPCFTASSRRCSPSIASAPSSSTPTAPRSRSRPPTRSRPLWSSTDPPTCSAAASR